MATCWFGAPTTIRSGRRVSSIAEPSRRNSGFETTSKLTGRRRFRSMMDQGALEEVRAMLPQWDPAALWAKAIGAPELVAHLRGKTSLAEAVDRAIIATRQYAKGQRIFFRNRMRDWRQIPMDSDPDT